MRDYDKEAEKRVTFIQDLLAETHAEGIIFGSSGGKDSALVGILAKRATPNVLGVIMPCQSSVNYGKDREDALLLGKIYGIEHIEIDLTATKASIVGELKEDLSRKADINIAPRLRMAALYALAANRNYLVAGTSNRSEIYMGYFTKWGDGASDFNILSDLTATEITFMLAHIDAPDVFLAKAPSAGLFEGQTDEEDMGVSYREIDKFLIDGTMGENVDKIIKANRESAHKRLPILRYRM